MALQDHRDIHIALIRMSYLGDVGMNEMIGLMRLHVQEVVRYTSIVASHIALSPEQAFQFESDCVDHNLSPDQFLMKKDSKVYFSFLGVYLAKISAKVHDIGKPFFREIYSKESRLSKEEFHLQKFHTNLGRLLIESWRRSCPLLADFPDLVNFVALCGPAHQEKFDGSGYPDGSAGKDIPFLGRLLALTDVISALINQRPYQDPITLKECMSRLEKDRGTHFDPEIFDQVMEMYHEGVLSEEFIRGQWLEKEKFSPRYMEFARSISLIDEQLHPVDIEQKEALKDIINQAVLAQNIQQMKYYKDRLLF